MVGGWGNGGGGGKGGGAKAFSLRSRRESVLLLSINEELCFRYGHVAMASLFV